MAKVLTQFETGWLRGAVASYFADGAVWGVGVSGGGDSTALLAGLVRAGFAGQLVVLHMNNGWGEVDEKAEKAVKALCKKLGVPMVVGRGAGFPEGGSWEEIAREERLALFAREVASRKLAGVMLAHNAEDVMEQVLMRLGRGSGLQGLVGLGAESTVRGVRLVRPLLPVMREALRVFLRGEGFGWEEDPFNADASKMRGRVRKVLPDLLRAGMTLDGVLSAVEALQDADAVVAVQMEAVLAQVADEGDGVALVRELFAACLPEVAARVVQALVVRVTGVSQVVRRQKRLALWYKITTQERGKATLGGSVWVWKKGRIVVRCEPLQGKTVR